MRCSAAGAERVAVTADPDVVRGARPHRAARRRRVRGLRGRRCARSRHDRGAGASAVLRRRRAVPRRLRRHAAAGRRGRGAWRDRRASAGSAAGCARSSRPTRRSRCRTWAGTMSMPAAPHPLIEPGEAYFLHSYHFVPTTAATSRDDRPWRRADRRGRRATISSACSSTPRRASLRPRAARRGSWRGGPDRLPRHRPQGRPGRAPRRGRYGRAPPSMATIPRRRRCCSPRPGARASPRRRSRRRVRRASGQRRRGRGDRRGLSRPGPARRRHPRRARRSSAGSISASRAS